MKKRVVSVIILSAIMLLGCSESRGNKNSVEEDKEVYDKEDNYVWNKGRETIFVIDGEGSLWSVGGNEYGQIGNGTITKADEIGKIIDDQDVSIPYRVMDNVDKYYYHEGVVHIIDKDKRLWSMGLNYNGLVGDGTTVNMDTPYEIMEDVEEIYINYGKRSMYIKDTSNNLWGLGKNDVGQIGNGSIEDVVSTPYKIMTGVKKVITANREDDEKLKMDMYDNTYVIKEDNSLWAFGINEDGTAGNGSSEEQLKPYEVMEKVIDVKGEKGAVYILDEERSVWGVGINVYDKSEEKQYKPYKIIEGVKEYEVSWGNLVTLTNNNELWTYGNNRAGTVGNGSREAQYKPYKVLENVKAIEVGKGEVYAIKEDDTLWVFGENDYGQLGVGSKEDVFIPEQIMKNVEEVRVYRGFAYVIDKDKILYSMGQSGSGQLGDGGYAGDTGRLAPHKVIEDVKEIVVKNKSTYVITESGDLWGFGYNQENQIGDGKYIDVFEPYKIDEDVIEIIPYNTAVRIEKEDGTMSMRGSNISGQLGIGT